MHATTLPTVWLTLACLLGSSSLFSLIIISNLLLPSYIQLYTQSSSPTTNQQLISLFPNQTNNQRTQRTNPNPIPSSSLDLLLTLFILNHHRSTDSEIPFYPNGDTQYIPIVTHTRWPITLLFTIDFRMIVKTLALLMSMVIIRVQRILPWRVRYVISFTVNDVELTTDVNRN